ncbi:MAG: hypothetical protein JW741_27750 [Sedimentisphaerales bacterium]|nr:hypothetical protein [Sedimentisphaerales bacterium]
MTLYSYCVRYDSGFAPNPFWGICTLAVCKPAIRRHANVGDWVVGLGSAQSPEGDFSDRVVYAMEITDKKTLRAYDQFCRAKYPQKIPDPESDDYRRRAGDCIYSYSNRGCVRQRTGFHHRTDQDDDLSGKHVLLSERFYYFGSAARRLPASLKTIMHPFPGHKSTANAPHAEPFVTWIQNLPGVKQNTVKGMPQLADTGHECTS